MVLDPIPQSLPVHFFGSRPQPPTSRLHKAYRLSIYIDTYPLSFIAILSIYIDSAYPLILSFLPTQGISFVVCLYIIPFCLEIRLFGLGKDLVSPHIGLFCLYMSPFCLEISLFGLDEGKRMKIRDL